MHDLTTKNGSFKGYIGECMFRLAEPRAYLVRYIGKSWYIETHCQQLSDAQHEFLQKYWYSLDAISVDTTKITLYEVKTRNEYSYNNPQWKNKFTKSTVDIYRKALSLGFTVLVATVVLHKNWQYDILLEPFDHAIYCIDAPKKYDRPEDPIMKL